MWVVGAGSFAETYDGNMGSAFEVGPELVGPALASFLAVALSLSLAFFAACTFGIRVM